jgi:hypothetical protein
MRSEETISKLSLLMAIAAAVAMRGRRRLTLSGRPEPRVRVWDHLARPDHRPDATDTHVYDQQPRWPAIVVVVLSPCNVTVNGASGSGLSVGVFVFVPTSRTPAVLYLLAGMSPLVMTS